MSADTIAPTSAKVKRSKKHSVDNLESTVGISSSAGAAQGVLPQIDDDVAAGGSFESKKRKREILSASELEIDVSLPEPPSKKALRKAKKQKPVGASTNTSKVVSCGSSEEVDQPRVAPPSTTADVRSAYGIWIGNLPFIATKPLLRAFLTSPESGSMITDAEITRVHMPAPANAAATRTQLKPLNKGFAYVDFATEQALQAALALSETLMGGRRVLIKDSKSFAGRPEKVAGEGGTNGESKKDGSRKENSKTMKPTKRVFVGNLGFDVTKDDLKEHYGKCGDVLDIHMATFEDSGKCKGFAWVTFGELEAAEAAVRGWIKIPEPGDGDDEDTDEEEEQDDGAEVGGEKNGDAGTKKKAQKQKKQKTRKWFVNRLQGRPLRCEYAEDASSRYKKRFGKDAGDSRQRIDVPPVEDVQIDGERTARASTVSRNKTAAKSAIDIQPGAPTDRNKRRGKVAGQPDVNYRTGAITESAGTKVTFD